MNITFLCAVEVVYNLEMHTILFNQSSSRSYV